MLILAGDPGIGKSRLASEAARYAAGRGFEVLIGHAVESTTPVPLRPFAEAIFGLARTGDIPDAPELAEYWPALGMIVPEWNRAAGGGARSEMSPLVLGEAVLRLLSVASERGTMLVLEELQWADPETLAVLEYLAHNIADRSVVCVVTVRGGEASRALELTQVLHSRRVGEIIDLPRLAERDVARMAAACLDQERLPGAGASRRLAHCEGPPVAGGGSLAAAVSSGEAGRTEAGRRGHGKNHTRAAPATPGRGAPRARNA